MPSSESQAELVLEPDDSPEHPLAAWYDDMRRRRREHYASRQTDPRSPRSRALITMIHNEPVFLPIWLGYYSRFFDPQDIYVFDNDSDAESVEQGGFVRLPVRRGRVDHAWMVRTIQGLQHELLSRYDMVLVTDVDEIVAPDPRFGTLGDYLDRFDEEWVNCLGYELLHVRDQEAPLRLDQPILAQRGYWYFNDAYDKAALATAPMDWRTGFHGRVDNSYNLDPDLRMIHLHRMDYDLCLERHRTRSQRRWARRDARRGWASHNRIVDAAEFERWFYEDAYFDRFEVKPEKIPEAWRGIF